jgi:hypothetical protein
MNTINLDLADLKANEWFGKINTNAVTDAEREYIDKLLTKIALNNVEDSVTFSDSRLVFIASKMLIAYGDKEVLLNEYGVDEFFIYLSYLKSFYDENNDVRDQLVKYVTIWISYLVSETPLTKEEAEKMNALSIEVFSLLSFENSAAQSIVPKFVIASLVQASQMEVNEVVQPIENKDIQNADLEDIEPEVKGESEEREAQIKELRDDIETFQFLIKAGATEEETKELEDALETFYFLLKSLGVDEEKEMAKGGSVKKVKSLKDIQNDPRVSDAYKDNSTGEIGYWMSLKEGYVSAWERGSSVRSEDLAYLKDMLNTPGGIITKEEFDTTFSEDEYAKGGTLDKKATYVPKRDIAEVEVEKNGKTKFVDGADLLDGVYVKKSKYAKGGSAGQVSYTILDDTGDEVVENADEEAIILFANTMFYYDAMDTGEEQIETLDEAISALKTMDYSVKTSKKK